MNNQRVMMIVIATCLSLLVGAGSAAAHASIARAEPPPNAALDAPPARIEIWFTEPIEPQFSRLQLRDEQGELVATAPSQINPTDPTHMTLVPGDLPDGVYTVVWRALSAADGHQTQGSYPLFIGAAASGGVQAAQAEAAVPAAASLIRWANLVSLSLLVGGLAFGRFVWEPTVSGRQPAVERRLSALVWVGWALVGLTGLLLLALQVAVVTDTPLLAGLDDPLVGPLIRETRFGGLWLARMALWVGVAAALWFARGDRWFIPLALALGVGLLLTNSLFSHASAAHDALGSVAADWVHLTATALWVGGLVQFFAVLGPARRALTPPDLGALTGRFSNYARVAVGALAITGLYAAWLHVGSLDGLLTTAYGQALLVKLVLFLPLLGLAGVNLLVTARRLNAGEAVWAGRLRGLVGAEIALTLTVLGAVGIMTSISPARTVLAERAVPPQPPPANPIIAAQTADDVTIQLAITPGWVGENTFTLTLTAADGSPIDDAALIRLRFDSQEQNLGQSELRPTRQGGGVYAVQGANLSIPGGWRIRATIQRPGRFDIVTDFEPRLALPPAPPPVVPFDPNAAPAGRDLALLLSGLVAVGVGGFFLIQQRRLRLEPAALLSVGLAGVGAALVISGALPGAAPANAAFVPQGFQPARMAVSRDERPPYLLTGDGALLAPVEGVWMPVLLPGIPIRDAYMDGSGLLWAATDSGLKTFQAGVWQSLDEFPSTRLELMHGYLFALGQGAISRVPAGGIELDRPRLLTMPLADQPVIEFVMLGNHSHVVLNGSQLFVSNDLGLSWDPIPAPAPVTMIWADVDGNLLAVTGSGLFTRNITTGDWSSPQSLPGASSRPTLRVFEQVLYAVSDGQLYRREGSAWRSANPPGAGDAYFTALEPQYPGVLWALDTRNGRLWRTSDGVAWDTFNISVVTNVAP